MAVSPEPPEAFERGRLFAGIPLELLHKALAIFGPEFHAIASARDGGVVILAIDEARSDRGHDIDSVIGLRLRRLARPGIAMVRPEETRVGEAWVSQCRSGGCRC